MYVRSKACVWRLLACLAFAGAHAPSLCRGAAAEEFSDASLIREINEANQRLEMTVNSSLVLTLKSRIPRLVVANPDLVSATPISENQVQIAARNPGVTQVNLWDEQGRVYTVDLLIFGDVKELEMSLKMMFPASALRVKRLSNSLVLEGQVDRPEIVSTIRSLAEDYAPKIINNITVGGAQQVALKVKVMEISRSKLRKMGFDWVLGTGDDFVSSQPGNILRAFDLATGEFEAPEASLSFGIVDGNTAFLGVLEALQQNRISKILADPTITTVSGRPAHFNVGGEIPIVVPAGNNMVGIEYRPYGTQVDFVPIVLGNGRIRLEVRPRVSDPDYAAGIVTSGIAVPAFNVREVDCGVEMNAGQTLALAGLIQERVEASHRGLPYLSDLPIVGAAFRRVEEEVNEIELLIMVTPEFVDGMDPCEAPACGPGMETMSPTNAQLYCQGLIEVPACGPCAAGPGAAGCPTAADPAGAMTPTPESAFPSLPGASFPAPDASRAPSRGLGEGSASVPTEKALPRLSAADPQQPLSRTAAAGAGAAPGRNVPAVPPGTRASDPSAPQNRPPQAVARAPGLIGPVGYDMQK
jgi:pilus assembly protein CpaC